MDKIRNKNFVIAAAFTLAMLILSFADFSQNRKKLDILVYDGSKGEFSAQEIFEKDSASWKKFSLRNSFENFRKASENGQKWFKTEIRNDSKVGRDLVIQFGYPHIAEAEFFREKNGHLESVYTIGNTRSFIDSRQLFGDHQYVFRMTISEKDKAVLYIKVKTDGLLRMPVYAFDAEDYELNVLENLLVLGIYFGGLVSLVLFNLILFYSTRDRTILAYVTYHFILLVFHFFYTGLSRAFPVRLANSASFMVMGHLVFAFIYFAISFIRRFLDLSRINPTINRGTVVLQILIVSIALSSVIIPSGAFFMCAFCYLVISILFCAFSFSTLSGNRNIKTFFIAWSGVIIAVSIHLMSDMQIIPSNSLTESVNFFGILWEAIFISKAIGDKIKDMAEAKQMVRTRLMKEDNLLEFKGTESVSSSLMKRRVTILFLDIVGFSIISSKIGTHRTFSFLSAFMDFVAQTIRKFNGTIDRSLGDGILAVFGDGESEGGTSNSIDRAFMTAVELQDFTISRYNMMRNIKEMPMLLRVGIHIDEVHIGNMGNEDRVDYTMIGRGVGFASLLESSCNPSRIMLSHDAKACLDRKHYNEIAMHQIFIKERHKNEYIKAFEYDPHFYKNEIVHKAIERHLDFIERKTTDDRIICHSDTNMKLSSC
ncbi:MAG: hypothetical protein HQK54_18535, partial [Oligoflexales bacterium]|nr:hypothetical protein [Oligoflexales bacterium]